MRMTVEQVRSFIKGMSPKTVVEFVDGNMIVHPKERVLKVSGGRVLDYDEVWKLHSTGLGSTEIAKRLGSTKQTVYSAIQSMRDEGRKIL